MGDKCPSPPLPPALLGVIKTQMGTCSHLSPSTQHPKAADSLKHTCTCVEGEGTVERRKGKPVSVLSRPQKRHGKARSGLQELFLPKMKWEEMITNGTHSLTLATLPTLPHPDLAALSKGFPPPKALPFLGWHHRWHATHGVQPPASDDFRCGQSFLNNVKLAASPCGVKIKGIAPLSFHSLP